MERKSMDMLGFGAAASAPTPSSEDTRPRGDEDGRPREYIPGLDVAERKFRERRTIASRIYGLLGTGGEEAPAAGGGGGGQGDSISNKSSR
jgi:hypothetical protein